MRVVYKASEYGNELFELFRDAFHKAKERDNWDLATLQESENSLTYTTCCGNIWDVRKDKGAIFFSYEGTRAGFLRATPFAPEMEIDPLSDNYIDIIFDDKGFIFELFEYETSTPPEWKVTPIETIEKVAEEPNKAVILRFGHPRKIVEYKNVYQKGVSEK
ncbi:MAG: hypothetical protein JTT12_05670 [Candidatus Brockarchaeota archaeon]|nr:hypothetical protein [Candidatus Brockarchaeota archaeon]